jgi:hypothetical protein
LAFLWDKKAVTSDRTLLLRQRVAFLGNKKALTIETIACLREGIIIPWANEPLPGPPIRLLTPQKELKVACPMSDGEA